MLFTRAAKLCLFLNLLSLVAHAAPIDLNKIPGLPIPAPVAPKAVPPKVSPKSVPVATQPKVAPAPMPAPAPVVREIVTQDPTFKTEDKKEKKRPIGWLSADRPLRFMLGRYKSPFNAYGKSLSFEKVSSKISKELLTPKTDMKNKAKVCWLKKDLAELIHIDPQLLEVAPATYSDELIQQFPSPQKSEIIKNIFLMPKNPKAICYLIGLSDSKGVWSEKSYNEEIEVTKNMLKNFKGVLDSHPDVKERLFSALASNRSLVDRKGFRKLEKFWIKELEYDEDSDELLNEYFARFSSSNVFKAMCDTKRGNCRPINLALAISIFELTQAPLRFSYVISTDSLEDNAPIVKSDLHLQVEAGNLGYYDRGSDTFEWVVVESSVIEPKMSEGLVDAKSEFDAFAKRTNLIQVNLPATKLQGAVIKGPFLHGSPSKFELESVSFRKEGYALEGHSYQILKMPAGTRVKFRSKQFTGDDNRPGPQSFRWVIEQRDFKVSLWDLLSTDFLRGKFLTYGYRYQEPSPSNIIVNKHERKVTYIKTGANTFQKMTELIVEDESEADHKFTEIIGISFMKNGSAVINSVRLIVDGKEVSTGSLIFS